MQLLTPNCSATADKSLLRFCQIVIGDTRGVFARRLPLKMEEIPKNLLFASALSPGIPNADLLRVGVMSVNPNLCGSLEPRVIAVLS